MGEGLRFVIRTPREVVVDARVRSVRLPTESGHVGLRPREEAFASVVEPGLCLLRMDEGVRFAATAGGLLDAAGETGILYTPFAVAGERGEDVLASLSQALATPDSELSMRRRLGELEQRIARELRQWPVASRPKARHG
ncbi:hypothetical protein [Myxococcus xanthus]|uniref:ATP synthase F1 complex delta/epsilon subunit N-terminal domain-containing protein n=1 Tax=Myxococcus xanthus TaxID=34 RepID=A0A7Y4IDL9_MYXXA|nr:hypothetical protein [Myxococcus xanthus]NOJ77209.1 hypothetical protein [Myxococcus xanthus]NOJ87614.1 hypothetical protein [Myxococcus xanthus]